MGKSGCIACGMPMEKDEDFAMRDRSKEYCRYCARPDGTMQNYEEKLAGMTAFIMRTEGIAQAAAQESARSRMAKLPAWSGKN